jgi:competence protein ComEA
MIPRHSYVSDNVPLLSPSISSITGTEQESVADSFEKVNINTATKMTLLNDLSDCQTGRGRAIGDKIADRIIDYRKTHRFRKIEDLLNVQMIGQKIYDAVKDHITV